jgi:hypothetical protein
MKRSMQDDMNGPVFLPFLGFPAQLKLIHWAQQAVWP